MKYTAQVPTKAGVISVQAESQKELAREVASVVEVFDERACGLCKGDDIVMTWRQASRVEGKTVETFDYSEWQCRKCGARLTLGNINDKSGRLFPNRKLLPNGKPVGKGERAQGSYGSHRGWTKFKGDRDDE